MNRTLLIEVVKKCRVRVSQDSTEPPPFSVEQLEEAVSDLADLVMRGSDIVLALLDDVPMPTLVPAETKETALSHDWIAGRPSQSEFLGSAHGGRETKEGPR